MIVRAAPPQDFMWIVERTGCLPSPAFRAIEAVDSDGAIAGMVAFDGWTPNGVLTHWAVDRPIALRTLLPAACEYAFRQAGKGVVIGVIPQHLGRSVRLAEHVGFRLAHRVRDGYAAGVDLLIHEMRRDECRWLEA